MSFSLTWFSKNVIKLMMCHFVHVNNNLHLCFSLKNYVYSDVVNVGRHHTVTWKI
jgi:plasmid maintenance system killer protein